MTEKSSSEVRMAALAEEMHLGIVALAGRREDCDNRESMIARAARRAGISYRQAKAFYYREAANPAAMAVEAVRRAIPCAPAEPVEEQLDRIARLERELTELRTIVAEAMARASGASALEPQRGDYGSGADAFGRAYREGIQAGALAQAARPVDRPASHERGRV